METPLGKITDFCATDTIPLPVPDVERKTVPIICPKCNSITGVVKWHVERNRRTIWYARSSCICSAGSAVIGGMRESESRGLGEYFKV